MERIMTAHGFTFFDTPIGRCAIAWGGRGIAGVQLPEARDTATRARLLSRVPDAREAPPPPEVRRALDAIAALFAGEPQDLSAVALDMERVPAFHRRVYETARAIPPGATLSYGEVAARLGAPGAARAVGQALRRNPFALLVPCHRVLASGAKIGGFSANGGITTKLRLLALETSKDGAAPLPFDPAAALAHLRAADARLARLIDAVGPFALRLKNTPTTFIALAEAIVYQQLTGRAAATIFARLCAQFPRTQHGPTPRQVLRAPDEKLRGAGLSRAKTLALRDLAQRTIRGEVPPVEELRGMEDDAIVERLTAVRGIGRWTAEMLLIFRLGRPDILPLDDYGIRKGFALTFGKRELPSREQLARWGARWKPYRTVASWYLWRALER